MLAAILCCGLLMTACSNEDNPAGPESPALAKALLGEWISEIEIDEFVPDDQDVEIDPSVKRDMTAEKPAWVINYPSAYLIPFSDSTIRGDRSRDSLI